MKIGGGTYALRVAGTLAPIARTVPQTVVRRFPIGVWSPYQVGTLRLEIFRRE